MAPVLRARLPVNVPVERFSLERTRWFLFRARRALDRALSRVLLFSLLFFSFFLFLFLCGGWIFQKQKKEKRKKENGRCTYARPCTRKFSKMEVAESTRMCTAGTFRVCRVYVTSFYGSLDNAGAVDVISPSVGRVYRVSYDTSKTPELCSSLRETRISCSSSLWKCARVSK